MNIGQFYILRAKELLVIPKLIYVCHSQSIAKLQKRRMEKASDRETIA